MSKGTMMRDQDQLLRIRRDQEIKIMVKCWDQEKELVLDFGEDNKDEDCELDLVQKLDNLDCMIYFNVIYTSFSNARL